MSEHFDLRALEPWRPVDINPHRYHSPEETQRLIDACRDDDRCGDRDVARYEQAHGVLWADEADDPAVVVNPDAQAAFFGLCGLVTVLALGVGARFAWDALTLEGRVVAGCLAAWVAVLWWRGRIR